MPHSESEIPTAPKRLPLLGHAHLVAGDPRKFLMALPELGPIVRVYLGPRPAYVLTTPDLIRQVALGHAGAFHREELREAISDLVTGSTNVLSGAEHDLRRRMIAPVFRQGRLTEYAGTVATLADDWSMSLPGGRSADLRPQVHDLVMRTMFATLFQADSEADEVTFIRERIPWLLGEVIIRGALPKPIRRLRVFTNRRYVRQANEVRAAMTSLIERHRRDDDRGDMLSELLRHVDQETGATLSDNDLVDELLLALAARHRLAVVDLLVVDLRNGTQSRNRFPGLRRTGFGDRARAGHGVARGLVAVPAQRSARDAAPLGAVGHTAHVRRPRPHR